MEFQGQLHDLDRYYLERRELEVRSRSLPVGAVERAENSARMRTLTCLIDWIRLRACQAREVNE